MTMNIVDIATTRYTTKVFDPERRIPEETMAQVRSLLRHSASSVNSQPWHFLIAHSDQARRRVARATQPDYAYNESKVLNASHVVVFCVRRDMDEAHLNALLAQEARDGRFPDAQVQAGQDKARRFYVELNRRSPAGLQAWMEKQVYLSLGTLLVGARALGLDACPMEGVDFAGLDAEFCLEQEGLRSIALVALGYRASGDFNARTPKSRLPEPLVMRTL
jgi:nitroreductase/dihydropteridine reductase